MKYNIQYDKRCLKYLKKLSKDNQLRIIKAINELPIGDANLIVRYIGILKIRHNE